MAQRDAAEKRPPEKKEADPGSSSNLSGRCRPDKARRRPWSQRAQDSGSRAGKPIRLNRVPLLRAVTSSPSTASQEVSRQPQGTVAVKRSSSLPSRRQGSKRRYPEGAAEPLTPEGPPAKRRRIGDVGAPSAETSSSSSARQAAARLSQDAESARRQAAPYRPPWLVPGSLTDNCSQPGPVRMSHVWRPQRRAKKPYSRPDNRLSRTR